MGGKKKREKEAKGTKGGDWRGRSGGCTSKWKMDGERRGVRIGCKSKDG